MHLYVSEKQKDLILSAYRINHFSEKTLGFKAYPNALILPSKPNSWSTGGVVDCNGVFIKESTLHEGEFDGAYTYDKDTVHIKNKCAVFLGTWVSIYGHAITDNIKKLWCLKHSDLDIENLDFVYILLGGGRFLNG